MLRRKSKCFFQPIKKFSFLKDFSIPKFGMYVAKFEMYIPKFGMYISKLEMKIFHRERNIFPCIKELFPPPPPPLHQIAPGNPDVVKS